MGIHFADELSGKLGNPGLPAGVCQADPEGQRRARCDGIVGSVRRREAE